MTELLRFLNANEVWIYLLLGLVGLVYARKFWLAIIEWRSSLFGLEKNNAQRRLTEATSILVLLILMMSGEFIAVTFVSPTYPDVQVLPTPTLDLLSTAAPTEASMIVVTGVAPTGEAVLPTNIAVSSTNDCLPNQIEFTYPTSGQEVQGKVTLKGRVNIPNFGFYKYEYTQPGSSTWTTIQAGDRVVTGCSGEACTSPTETAEPSDDIGIWDTSQLTPGDYLLQLVVTDNQGKAYPSCVVSVRVVAAQ